MPNKIREIFGRIGEIFYWFRQVKVAPTFFFLSVFCKFGSVFFNLLGLRLFIPFLQGLISGHFEAPARSVGILRFFADRYPQLFGHSASFLTLILTLIVLSFLVKSVLDYVSALCLGQQVRRAEAAMLQLLLDRILKLGKAFFDTSNMAGVCHKITSIPKAVAGQLKSLQAMLSQSMTLLAYVGILCWISLPLTLATILVFPIHHYTTAWLVSRVKDISRQHEASQVNLAERMFNIFSCIPLVKSYAAEATERKRLAESGQEEIELAFEMQRKQLFVKPVQEIGTMVSLLLIALIMVFVARGHDPGRAPSYLVFFFIVRRAMPNFGAVADFRLSMANTQGAFDRLRKLFDQMPDYSVAGGAREFDGLRKSIRFSDLTFAYRKGLPVLHGLDFSIEKGQMTAIVGATGAGKSTIAQLLMRFYDCPPAAILVDGVDIREFTLKSLVQQIAYVSQEPLLFNDTLRANITYGLETPPSDRRLEEIIEQAQLAEWVGRLPEGLDTWIGDRGVKLSGGERQRVAVARAFLKGADILILDEATSALDTKTERLIQAAIDRTIAGHTAVVIAHRLSTIIHADKIVVIEQGRLVEQGPLGELLEKRGAFYRYWKSQEYSESRSNANGGQTAVPENQTDLLKAKSAVKT